MSRALLAALAAGALCSCAMLDAQLRQTTLPPVPRDIPLNPHTADQAKALIGAKECSVAERNQFEITAEDEYWFGRSVAARLLARYPGDQTYPAAAPVVVYLNEVGQAAAAAATDHLDLQTAASVPAGRRFPAEARLEDTPDRPVPTRGYHFILVRDPAPNAYGLPGGFVVVTDGLLRRTASEDELAGVLAHEIAHVQRGHGVEIVKDMQCKQKASLLGQVGQAVKDARASSSIVARLTPDKLLDLLDAASQKVVESVLGSGYGASSELEADAFGTRFLAGAHYAPLAIADLLTRLGSDAAFVAAQSRSHPPPAQRIAAIQAVVAAQQLQPGQSVPARAERFGAALSDPLLTPPLRSER